jgi:hypothetical protein
MKKQKKPSRQTLRGSLQACLLACDDPKTEKEDFYFFLGKRSSFLYKWAKARKDY